MNVLINNSERGFIFPMVILSLLIFSLIGLMLVFRFSGTGAKEFVVAKETNMLYEAAQAGITRVQYELKRPDDPAQAHKWSIGPPNTYKIKINGIDVTVKAEDVYWND